MIQARDVVNLVWYKRIKIPLTASVITLFSNNMENRQVTRLYFLVDFKVEGMVKEMLEVELAIIIVTTNAKEPEQWIF